jgi:hypothetical protein
MEDTIEICTGCGKMPRALERAEGSFVCSRCGNHATQQVSAEEYEKVAVELDSQFHMATQKSRIESAASAPVEMRRPKKAARKARAKAGKKKSPKKR